MNKTLSITAILTLAVASTGIANAGRYIDQRHALQNAPDQGSTASLHTSAYGGRATDQPHQLREVVQPTAEFAVMDVGERAELDSGINRPSNYGGRYTDHLHRRH